MNLRARRVRAILTKEFREYSRNRNIIVAMSIYPLIFTVQPLISVFVVRGAAAASLSGRHELLFMLGIPILVPATLAAFAVAGERQQETLEPVLESPISREEFLLGKALAVFVPAVVIAYIVFALYILVIQLFAEPAVASAVIDAGDIVAQVLFTPLLAAWSIWVGIAISTRTSDARVAQQLSVVSSLPLLLLTVAFAFSIIEPSLELAVIFGVALLVADVLGWRLIAPLFDRERLISGPH
jgi:ABC-2 type transport system permease protein